MSVAELLTEVQKLSEEEKHEFFEELRKDVSETEFSDAEEAEIEAACEEGWQQCLRGESMPAEEFFKRLKEQ